MFIIEDLKHVQPKEEKSASAAQELKKKIIDAAISASDRVKTKYYYSEGYLKKQNDTAFQMNLRNSQTNWKVTPFRSRLTKSRTPPHLAFTLPW